MILFPVRVLSLYETQIVSCCTKGCFQNNKNKILVITMTELHVEEVRPVYMKTKILEVQSQFYRGQGGVLSRPI